MREDNKKLGSTITYAYDNGGNILCKHAYAFTLRELGEADSEIAYAYDGDRLISYNGESCAYNVLGNPTTYRGKAVTWLRGKLLSKYGDTTFTYDGAGKRTGKGSITFTYDSEGRLIKQSNGGNVVALINTSGAKVAEYIYDAWGNHAVVDSNGNDIESGIGVLNPFRYRGYYYDTETELYFLQTRYYDPEVGRFISRDSIEYADPETINGLNLYAYCGNNPVMNVDPNGTALWDWIIDIAVVTVSAVAAVVTAGTSLVLTGALAGIAVSGAVSIVSQVAENGDLDIARFTTDIINGALSGAWAATGIGVLGQIVGNTLFSVGTNRRNII